MKTILIITHSGDYYNIDRVQKALSDRGFRSIRLNTDDFPTSIKINEWIDAEGSRLSVMTPELTFGKEEVSAVWLRKIWAPKVDAEMEPHYQEATIREAIAIRTSFFQALEDLPWLDTLPAISKASDKYHQLCMAQKVGLTIPKTIISNDPKAVERFYDQLEEEMIAKLHTPLSFGMETDDFFFYTTKINPEDLEDLEMLTACPMIFQELIPKSYELRIAYIDGHCFAGRLDTAQVMDWRQADPAIVKWQAYTVSNLLRQQLVQLMNQLQLSFGAIDLIRRTDGQYVFLEVNPIGEWGMLEKELDLPISKFIAEGLINRIQ